MKGFMMRLIIVWLVILSPVLVQSQNFILPLWPEGSIPLSVKTDEKEIHDSTEIVRIRNVQVPDIAVFLPAKRNATRQAVIICPGGGYRILAYDWEGTDMARWLNSKGIAAIVLKYRLPSAATNPEAHKIPLMDVQRAMRLVRYHASEWNIDPSKVGVMGFSAGGHLASTLSVRYDHGNLQSPDPVERLSCRPVFSILVYPVISADPVIGHQGSFRALLGENPSQDMLDYYSNEKHITADTPPAILIHSGDDKGVPVQNSIRYYEGLLKNNVPAQMHIYPFGGHGYGLALDKGYLSTWTDRVVDWLKEMGKDDDL
jgi:acetyl esterase/lipase